MRKGFLYASMGLILVALFCAGQMADAQQKLVLSENGKSDYKIVISRNASPSEKHAADELQMFLEKIGGAKLPIVDDAAQFSPKEIILGNNKHLEQANVKIDLDKLGKEGFTIKTKGDTLIIAGGRLRGTMYGVYTFLEDYLGCRWYTDKVSKIPKMEKIEISPISNNTQIPILEYRDAFFRHTWDADWSARNKITGHNCALDEKRGGKTMFYPFVHSFNAILNPKDYFKEHPEYFSMRDGVRIGGRTQLCLTNPDVLRITIETVKGWLKEHPETTIVSVSQNDWGNWCECPKCKALDEREGSHSGSLLAFVNKVAEAVEKDYPNVAIETLAYQYTRKPPKNIRPRKNVIVRLCTIECCFTHPIESCDFPQNISFKNDIEGWSKISDRLYVWDYVVDFRHYFMPFPNLEALQPNIKFFAACGVKGIFEEGNGGFEMVSLRAYLLAKLLWNPDIDVEAVMDDFLEGYYGNAAPYVKQYMKMTHAYVKENNVHLGCFAKLTDEYPPQIFLDKGFLLFREAKKLELSPEQLRRVELAELPIIYVYMMRTPGDKLDSALVNHFFKVIEEEKIRNITINNHYTPQMFRNEIMKKMGK